MQAAAALYPSFALADNAPPVLSILGLTIGMTPDDVSSVIKNNPTDFPNVIVSKALCQDATGNQYVCFETVTTDPTTNGLPHDGLPNNSPQTINIQFSSPLTSNHAEAIYRDDVFSHDPPLPMYSDLLQSAFTQFGLPLGRINPGDTLVWPGANVSNMTLDDIFNKCLGPLDPPRWLPGQPGNNYQPGPGCPIMLEMNLGSGVYQIGELTEVLISRDLIAQDQAALAQQQQSATSAAAASAPPPPKPAL